MDQFILKIKWELVLENNGYENKNNKSGFADHYYYQAKNRG